MIIVLELIPAQATGQFVLTVRGRRKGTVLMLSVVQVYVRVVLMVVGSMAFRILGTLFD